MAAQTYDIITVGGGIAGSILARAMAEHGAKVLVLESTTSFRDRVRGEAIATWSTKEAMDLGVYDTLMAAGANHLRYWNEYHGTRGNGTPRSCSDLHSTDANASNVSPRPAGSPNQRCVRCRR